MPVLTFKRAEIYQTFIEKDTEADKWEERRYEIAKELFVHQHLSAYNAVTEADSLIKYLKNMPNSN